jgi:hypothetical protein
MTVAAVPSFSRVEITHGGKPDLIIAATELRLLAGELDFITSQKFTDEEAVILAHHKIKATSKKLRGKNAD